MKSTNPEPTPEQKEDSVSGGSNINMNIFQMPQQSYVNEEQASQLRQICAMLGFRDIGQFVKCRTNFLIFLYMYRHDRRYSKLNEICLKLLHVIQGAMQRIVCNISNVGIY